MPEKKPGLLDWRALLRHLGRRGVTHLLVGGGGDVLGSAFLANIVNEAYFFIAPILIGGKKAVGSVGGEGVAHLEKTPRFKRWSLERVGKDFLYHGTL